PPFPGLLLVPDLAHLGAGLGLHPEEPARAPDMAAVRHEDDLLSVGRPGWGDVVIVRAVVVARQAALVVLGQPRDLSRIALLVQSDAVDVEAPLVDGRYEEKTASV